MVVGDKTGKYSTGISTKLCTILYNRINRAHFLRCLSVGHLKDSSISVSHISPPWSIQNKSGCSVLYHFHFISVLKVAVSCTVYGLHRAMPINQLLLQSIILVVCHLQNTQSMCPMALQKESFIPAFLLC